MKLVTFSGPPSSGKTSIIVKLVEHLSGAYRTGVVKFDCLTSSDGDIYREHGIPVQTGVSGALCPDHFFASNIGACMEWGRRRGLDLLISESAGLCNRCSPHLRDVAAVCVIDILSGIDAPRKIGPMLKLADVVVITKSDLVSQAEREVFALNVVRANPRAKVLFANGLTGQGVLALSQLLAELLARQSEGARRLRFSIPGAVCSYCFGETQIGEKFATGNIKYMTFDDAPTRKSADAQARGNARGKLPRAFSGATAAANAEAPAPPNAHTEPDASAAEAPKPASALLDAPYRELAAAHPVACTYFGEVGLAEPSSDTSAREHFASFSEFDLLDCGMSAEQLAEGLLSFIEHMESLGRAARNPVRELRIVGGTDKSGAPEDFDITVRAGDVVCIVGPTGSGKSRLLEDIEYLAQGDTPTKRRVLVDGRIPAPEVRYAVENKLVAQLSQSMVFVMDLPVEGFLRLHAESRMMPENAIDELVARTIECANDLAGEPFSPETSLTALSGGQSRALMIADLAYLSLAPIVLIDEIENAGVDRKRALDLLVSSDKIVFVVTHDPLIALMGKTRLVIGGGGVRSVIAQSAHEAAGARELYALDERIASLRARVRRGERIEFDLESFLATRG